MSISDVSWLPETLTSSMAKPSRDGDGLDDDRELAAEIGAVEAGDREQACRQDRGRIARRFEIAVRQAAEQARRAAQEARQHDAVEATG